MNQMQDKQVNSQLLCTFTNNDYLEATIADILQSKEYLIDDKILVLQYTGDPESLFCIYNVETAMPTHLNKTILIHRKKRFNTLYTINSLNRLILLLNGTIDRSFKIPWEEYTNTIMLIQNDKLNILKTELKKVVKSEK